MKISKDPSIWFKENKEEVEVGFTEVFSKNVLSEAFQVLVVSQKLKKNKPLLSVETNDGFLTINTPSDLDGLFVCKFLEQAKDCPDSIGTQAVLILSKVPPVKKAKKVEEEAPRRNAEAFREFLNTFNQRNNVQDAQILQVAQHHPEPTLFPPLNRVVLDNDVPHDDGDF